MQIAVSQRLQILFEGRHMLSLFFQQLALVGFSHLQNPQDDKRCTHKQCHNAIQQNQKRIITSGVFIDTLGFIIDFLLSGFAKTRQAGQIGSTGVDHIENEGNFQQEYNDSLHLLLMSEQTGSHQNHSELHASIAIMHDISEAE